jgi:VIT1/CCC1 family predicted Fe2+/Mn2+ transporter
MSKPLRSSLYVRNIIFGVEDSLVSTVGLLSGIAYAEVPHQYILMTGLILIFVEGVSMAIGSFLSEESAEEYESGKEALVRAPALGALAMLVSYIVAGFIPLAPYLVSAGDTALVWSVSLSVMFLAVLGYVQARISKVPAFRRALRMMLLGGFAIFVGIMVGKVFGV